jgi:Uma2 family endonuclease
MPFVITADELELLPYDRKRREIIRGRLHVPQIPDFVHQDILMHLMMQVYEAVEIAGAGKVYTFPVTVRFSTYTQVQPDLVAIRSDRMEIFPINIVHGAPDIVVEVLSPETSQFDQVEKKSLYERNGVPEYWIVDPKLERLTIFRLTDSGYAQVEPEDGLLRSTAVTDFTIDPAALFANVVPE